MAEVNSAFVGAAGAHYVAARIYGLNLQCAPTFRNMPFVDILASNINGSKLASVQVKTSWNAVRARGRGMDRTPDHYEWDIGEHTFDNSEANSDSPRFLIALVDLREFKQQPDVFVLPPSVLAVYAKKTIDEKYGGDRTKWKRWMYHPKIEDLANFKNDWTPLLNVTGP